MSGIEMENDGINSVLSRSIIQTNYYFDSDSTFIIGHTDMDSKAKVY